VYQAIELAPRFSKVGKDSVNLFITADIAVKYQVTAEITGKFSDSVLKSFADIGKGEFGAFAMAGLRDAVSDRAIREYARNQYFFTLQECHVKLLSDHKPARVPAKRAILGRMTSQGQMPSNEA
jgi:hypothetical protein